MTAGRQTSSADNTRRHTGHDDVEDGRSPKEAHRYKSSRSTQWHDLKDTELDDLESRQDDLREAQTSEVVRPVAPPSRNAAVARRTLWATFSLFHLLAWSLDIVATIDLWHRHLHLGIASLAFLLLHYCFSAVNAAWQRKNFWLWVLVVPAHLATLSLLHVLPWVSASVPYLAETWIKLVGLPATRKQQQRHQQLALGQEQAHKTLEHPADFTGTPRSLPEWTAHEQQHLHQQKTSHAALAQVVNHLFTLQQLLLNLRPALMLVWTVFGTLPITAVQLTAAVQLGPSARISRASVVTGLASLVAAATELWLQGNHLRELDDQGYDNAVQGKAEGQQQPQRAFTAAVCACLHVVKRMLAYQAGVVVPNSWRNRMSQSSMHVALQQLASLPGATRIVVLRAALSRPDVTITNTTPIIANTKRSSGRPVPRQSAHLLLSPGDCHMLVPDLLKPPVVLAASPVAVPDTFLGSTNPVGSEVMLNSTGAEGLQLSSWSGTGFVAKGSGSVTGGSRRPGSMEVVGVSMHPAPATVTLSLEGFDDLAEATRSLSACFRVLMPHALTHLSLCDVRLHHEAYQVLGEFLTHQDCVLRSITLKEQNLSRVALTHLCQSLMANRSVQELDLSSNHLNQLGPKVPKDVRMLLEENTTLTKLNLSYTGIGSEAAAEVILGAVCSHSLTHLDLSQNRISDCLPAALLKAYPGHGSVLTHLNMGFNWIQDCIPAWLLLCMTQFPLLTHVWFDHCTNGQLAGAATVRRAKTARSRPSDADLSDGGNHSVLPQPAATEKLSPATQGMILLAHLHAMPHLALHFQELEVVGLAGLVLPFEYKPYSSPGLRCSWAPPRPPSSPHAIANGGPVLHQTSNGSSSTTTTLDTDEPLGSWPEAVMLRPEFTALLMQPGYVMDLAAHPWSALTHPLRVVALYTYATSQQRLLITNIHCARSSRPNANTPFGTFTRWSSSSSGLLPLSRRGSGGVHPSGMWHDRATPVRPMQSCNVPGTAAASGLARNSSLRAMIAQGLVSGSGPADVQGMDASWEVPPRSRAESSPGRQFSSAAAAFVAAGHAMRSDRSSAQERMPGTSPFSVAQSPSQASLAQTAQHSELHGELSASWQTSGAFVAKKIERRRSRLQETSSSNQALPIVGVPKHNGPSRLSSTGGSSTTCAGFQHPPTTITRSSSSLAHRATTSCMPPYAGAPSALQLSPPPKAFQSVLSGALARSSRSADLSTISPRNAGVCSSQGSPSHGRPTQSPHTTHGFVPTVPHDIHSVAADVADLSTPDVDSGLAGPDADMSASVSVWNCQGCSAGGIPGFAIIATDAPADDGQDLSSTSSLASEPDELWVSYASRPTVNSAVNNILGSTPLQTERSTPVMSTASIPFLNMTRSGSLSHQASSGMRPPSHSGRLLLGQLSGQQGRLLPQPQPHGSTFLPASARMSFVHSQGQSLSAFNLNTRSWSRMEELLKDEVHRCGSSPVLLEGVGMTNIATDIYTWWPSNTGSSVALSQGSRHHPGSSTGRVSFEDSPGRHHPQRSVSRFSNIGPVGEAQEGPVGEAQEGPVGEAQGGPECESHALRLDTSRLWWAVSTWAGVRQGLGPLCEGLDEEAGDVEEDMLGAVASSMVVPMVDRATSSQSNATVHATTTMLRSLQGVDMWPVPSRANAVQQVAFNLGGPSSSDDDNEDDLHLAPQEALTTTSVVSPEASCGQSHTRTCDDSVSFDMFRSLNAISQLSFPHHNHSLEDTPELMAGNAAIAALRAVVVAGTQALGSSTSGEMPSVSRQSPPSMPTLSQRSPQPPLAKSSVAMAALASLADLQSSHGGWPGSNSSLPQPPSLSLAPLRVARQTRGQIDLEEVHNDDSLPSTATGNHAASPVDDSFIFSELRQPSTPLSWPTALMTSTGQNTDLRPSGEIEITPMSEDDTMFSRATINTADGSPAAMGAGHFTAGPTAPPQAHPSVPTGPPTSRPAGTYNVSKYVSNFQGVDEEGPDDNNHVGPRTSPPGAHTGTLPTMPSWPRSPVEPHGRDSLPSGTIRFSSGTTPGLVGGGTRTTRLHSSASKPQRIRGTLVIGNFEYGQVLHLPLKELLMPMWAALSAAREAGRPSSATDAPAVPVSRHSGPTGMPPQPQAAPTASPSPSHRGSNGITLARLLQGTRSASIPSLSSFEYGGHYVTSNAPQAPLLDQPSSQLQQLGVGDVASPGGPVVASTLSTPRLLELHLMGVPESQDLALDALLHLVHASHPIYAARLEKTRSLQLQARLSNPRS